MDQFNDNYGWQSADPTPAHAYLLPNILKLLPGDSPLNILDAGCGNGFLAGKLASRGHHVTGVDISQDGVDIARKNYPQIGFHIASLYDNLEPIVQNVDLVISSEVIEHLFSPKTFLENISKVLKPRGSIILTTPYHGFLKNLALSLIDGWDTHHTANWEGGHIKFFSPKTLKILLANTGYINAVFNNAGRIPYLWKSMICRAEKP